MTTYLLDTCTFIWYATGQTNMISPAAAGILAAPGSSLALSVVSFQEIAFKISAGRLNFPTPLRRIERRFTDSGKIIYALDTAVLDIYISLPAAHPDPFDRLIAATAMTHLATVLSPDTAFDAYEVPRAW